MKVKSLSIVALSATLFLITACNNDEKYAAEKQPVKILSSVAGEEINPVTRAVGSSWSANDAIGVFMKRAGQELSASEILNDADNAKYITTAGNSYFTPADISQAIFLPETESVDFIAYYPYQETITDYKYNVDLSDQSSPERNDLLYSDNAVNQNRLSSVGTIDMSFSRQLAKLKFNITTNEYITTLNGLTVTISGQSTKGVFNLANGQLTIDEASVKDFESRTVISGATAISEVIIFPINDKNQTSVTFTLPNGKKFKHHFSSTTKFEKGANYTYDIVLEADEGIIEENYGYFETPVKTSIDNTIFVQHLLPSREGRNYSMLFDEKYRLAYWVAYPLHPYYIGDSGRNERWTYDPRISQNSQPHLSSGWGISNIDRGHQIPSADRTYSKEENETTFYFSNLTAQNSQLNQRTWGDLEGKVREWMKLCDTMYVVTGAMITTATDKEIEFVKDNSGKDVAKPKYYYKALAQKIGNTYYTIAYKMNNEYSGPTSFDYYRMTVKALEEETGFTFFPGISTDAKSEIETSKWQ